MPEKHVLQEVLQWLTWYFAESGIQKGIMETQLAEKNQAKGENDED